MEEFGYRRIVVELSLSSGVTKPSIFVAVYIEGIGHCYVD